MAFDRLIVSASSVPYSLSANTVFAWEEGNAWYRDESNGSGPTITWDTGNWYLHFALQDSYGQPQPTVWPLAPVRAASVMPLGRFTDGTDSIDVTLHPAAYNQQPVIVSTSADAALPQTTAFKWNETTVRFEAQDGPTADITYDLAAGNWLLSVTLSGEANPTVFPHAPALSYSARPLGNFTGGGKTFTFGVGAATIISAAGQDRAMQVEWCEAYAQFPLMFTAWPTGEIFRIQVQRHLLKRRIYAAVFSVEVQTPSLRWTLELLGTAGESLGTIPFRNTASLHDVPPYYRSCLTPTASGSISPTSDSAPQSNSLTLQIYRTDPGLISDVVSIPALELTADCAFVRLNLISPEPAPSIDTSFYLGVFSSVQVKG